jgi:nucleoside-diphosphate-sugar epimerase
LLFVERDAHNEFESTALVSIRNQETTMTESQATTNSQHARTRHVVLGAGVIGSNLARRLAERGEQVRLITRSGSGPGHPGIERVAADAGDVEALSALADGAATIFNCANPPYPKWASAWPSLSNGVIAACERSGARLVTMSNLYGYGADSSPMRATDELAPPTRKGAIRAATWRAALTAHEAGRIKMTEVRASDFIGPGVGANGHIGDRFVPRLLAGKSISVLGRTDVEHSWTYVDDVVTTMLAVAQDDRALGRAWHVPTGPPLTVAQLAAEFAAVADVPPVKVKAIPTALLKVAGIVSPTIRELPEMLYQFERPFVIDATDTTETFGIVPTPLAEQLQATIASYRLPEHDAVPARRAAA